jgi:hypothetical protein
VPINELAGGGIVSGPDTGYIPPALFHGTEVVMSEGEVSGIKDELEKMREILWMMLNVEGDNKEYNRKMHKILDYWDKVDGSLVVGQVA